MLPFVRLFDYGNITPGVPTPKDFFLDVSSGKPTMLMLLDNGEVWGCSNDGQLLGLNTTASAYGKPYFVMENVKLMFASVWGTLLITNDNKVKYTGRQTMFNGSSNYWSTFQDFTTKYTAVGIDISTIEKVGFNTGTLFLRTTNGDLWGHGNNANGYFGKGNTVANYTPTKIKTNTLDFWLTNGNAIVQTGTKEFYATGDNYYYQMGVTTTGNITTWTQIFKDATDDPEFEYNAMRTSQATLILYGKGTTFYASGRNYMSSWGVSGAPVDVNTTLYKGTLPFVPGDLTYFYAGREQAYWTNLIIDTNGVLYISGTKDGGGGSNAPIFEVLPTPSSAVGFKCGTATRSYAIMDCTGNQFMYARGTALSDPAGFTPMSTPLNHTWTHITDFKFNR